MKAAPRGRASEPRALSSATAHVTIAVIGAADATRDLYLSARWVQRAPLCGVVVVTGGRGGVMESCVGALAQGGAAFGILPGMDGGVSSQRLRPLPICRAFRRRACAAVMLPVRRKR
ncbi:MAG: hypothetical protein R3E12_11840 [Candidatus Eisenbacteria bacterium]